MKKFYLVLICFLWANSVLAEMIICPKLKGRILALDGKYRDIDTAADKIILQRLDDIVTIITNDEEKMDCPVIANDKNYFTCISVQNLSVNVFTYYKKDKKLLYSKHNHLLGSGVQYHAFCEE